jgi:hypothetical protein
LLYDFKTHQWRSTEGITIDNPTWSLDSNYVYYDLEEILIKGLRRVSVADGHVDEVVKLEGYPLLSWWWSGVAPDNSPLVLRNLGSLVVAKCTR